MPDLTFYGASDDLIEVEGVFSEEYGSEDMTFLVVDGGQQAKVRVTYIGPGVWAIQYAPVDEEIDGLAGRMDIDRYTAKLTLEVSDKARVHVLAGGDDE